MVAGGARVPTRVIAGEPVLHARGHPKMKVGILGSGDVARSLTKGFLATGHEVRLGTRSGQKEELAMWIATEKIRATQHTFAVVAEWGEIIVLATHGLSGESVVHSSGAAHFRGKVVIDATNPLVMSPNAPPSLGVSGADSAGERFQRWLPDAHVVKAFNTIGNTLFFHPKLPGGPPDMFICGNDAAAKATVTQILHSFGWSSVVDIGGIEGARELESLCILWVKSALALGNWSMGFRLLRT